MTFTHISERKLPQKRSYEANEQLSEANKQLEACQKDIEEALALAARLLAKPRASIAGVGWPARGGLLPSGTLDWR